MPSSIERSVEPMIFDARIHNGGVARINCKGVDRLLTAILLLTGEIGVEMGVVNLITLFIWRLTANFYPILLK